MTEDKFSKAYLAKYRQAFFNQHQHNAHQKKKRSKGKNGKNPFIKFFFKTQCLHNRSDGTAEKIRRAILGLPSKRFIFSPLTLQIPLPQLISALHRLG